MPENSNFKIYIRNTTDDIYKLFASVPISTPSVNMSPRKFLIFCRILGITSNLIVNSSKFNLEVNHQHLTENIPTVLVHIFEDTYIFMANTVSLVPGCIYPRTTDIQNDVLRSLLIQHTGDSLALEIQTDFSNYDTSTVTFVLFIDSYESFR